MSIGVLFVSSVQKELQQERYAIRDYISGDPLLRQFFTAFLFEDLPAGDRTPGNVYLNAVDSCKVYVGIFGDEYGRENPAGFSPTELEFDRATEKGVYRIVLVKGSEDGKRHPKMRLLIRKAESQLVRRRFSDTHDLISELYASLVEFLATSGALQTLPFDASPCPGAKLNDISDEKLKWFLRQARQERNFPLAESSTVRQTFEHLNLLDGGKPKYAAIVLFGEKPQKFVPVAEIKCLHFHGTGVQKPIPSYQLFKGTAFDQVDQAVDFVLSKLNRKVIPRKNTPASRIEYEIPYEVVREAIVNAVAHRDYTSNAAVQVMVFADRFEVWNPGALPPGMTLDQLRRPHPSVPHNPLIADPLYLTHYIEKAGTGTVGMIDLCNQAGLPEPDFEERGNQFVLTVWRDWWTNSFLSQFKFNERHHKAVVFIKVHHQITNAEYQQLTGATRKTAARDLEYLVTCGLLRPEGSGRGAYYIRTKSRKRDFNETIGTFSAEVENETLMGQMRHQTRHKPDTKKKGSQSAYAKRGSSRNKRMKGDKKGPRGT